MIKQALYSKKVARVHRLRARRATARSVPGSWKLERRDVFKPILDAMKEVDPDAKKALDIANELSKKKL